MNDIQAQTKNNASEKLAGILRQSLLPLSTRELAVRLRLRHLRLADYQVSGLLRSMAWEGLIEFQRGRWSTPSDQNSEKSYPTSRVAFPKLSDETHRLLGQKSENITNPDPRNDVELVEADIETANENASSGRWGTFRKLLGYYRQCIRNEEGADASAFQNQYGKQFIYLHK